MQSLLKAPQFMEKKAVKKIEWQAWMDLDRSICFNVHWLLLLFAEYFVISLRQLWRRRWWWHGNAWRRKRRSLITILSPGQEAETKDFHRETCCKALCINFSARPCHPCRRNVRVVERCLGWEFQDSGGFVQWEGGELTTDQGTSQWEPTRTLTTGPSSKG